VAWHNDTGKDLHGVQLKLRMMWTPKNQNPPPVNSLPIYMDVNLTVGGSNSFDVNPGRTEKAWEFTMPLSGRLLGFGGHMHDYGTIVRLEDVERGKVIARVNATRKADGKVTKVSRSLPGVGGDGIKLEAGRRYRVIGVYDNPTGQKITRGAMAHIVGLFAPDEPGRWPKVDLTDETLQDDLASLNEMGKAAAHAHDNH
jgi:hypothetical protein